jgi:hypothetical protein
MTTMGATAFVVFARDLWSWIQWPARHQAQVQEAR